VRRLAVPSKRPPSPPGDACVGPSDDQLRLALERVLSRAGAGVPVAVGRRQSEYRSTFPLEDLTVTLQPAGELRLAFKRLEWNELDRSARLAKPSFLFDSTREPAVYSSLLPTAPAGPPRYFGSTVTDGGAGRWLFLEWVDGRELYQVGERAVWARVARWLGEMHASLAPGLERHVAQAPLLAYDAAHYRRWIWRARQFATSGGRSSDAARFLEWLAKRYDAVVEALLELPRTVLHGDFYASNVLVADGVEQLRVAPVDWELAAAGPGLIDLAALISGDWADAEREEMTAAYASVPGIARFSSRELDFARLQLAVQWLGWAPPAWVPPEGQRHDWLTEALTLAQELDI
jgi:aminoglycoside phosphotransferase (APT) family kinase protein